MSRGWDRWARVYGPLERVVLGGELERARALTAELVEGREGSEDWLLLGVGDGRGLERLIRALPHATFHVLDLSPGMLERAGRRLGPGAKVRWHAADLRSGLPEGLRRRAFAGVVTPFLLDCFTDGEIGGWWEDVANRLRPGGIWLVADFTPPGRLRGWRALRQRTLLTLLYRAFGLTTSMTARRLPELDRPFLAAGWRPELRRATPAEITSVVRWQKPEGAPLSPLRI